MALAPPSESDAVRGVFCIYHLPPEPLGGAERYALELAAWLNSRGHDIAVLGSKQPIGVREQCSPDARDHVIALRPLGPHRYYGHSLALTRWFRSVRPTPDFVQVSDLNHQSAVAIAAARSRGIRTILKSEGEPAFQARNLKDTGIPGFPGWCLRQLRQADQVVSVSCQGLRDLDLLGFSLSQAVVFPTAIDALRWRPPSPSERAAARRSLGTVGRYACAYVARFRPEKGHLFAVRVWSEVVRRIPEALLLMPSEGPLLVEAREQVEKAGIQRNVSFLGSLDDVRDLLWAVDLLALFSESEGSPLSVVEGQACGVPVVASKVGGLPESVLDGLSGVLVGSGDLAAAVDAVLLLSQISERARFAETAREFVLRERSRDVVWKAYETFLEGSG